MSSITSTRFDFKFSTEFIGFNWKFSWLKTRKFLYRYSFFFYTELFLQRRVIKFNAFSPKVRPTERACYLTIWKIFFKSKGLLLLFSKNNFITITSPPPPPPCKSVSPLNERYLLKAWLRNIGLRLRRLFQYAHKIRIHVSSEKVKVIYYGGS